MSRIRYTSLSRRMVSLVIILACLSFSSAAYATDEPITPHDVLFSNQRITTVGAYSDTLYVAQVCNEGPGSLTGFTYHYSSTNFDVQDIIFSKNTDDPSHATDFGSLDEETGVWSGGLIEPNQCVNFVHTGTITGEIGQTIEFTAELTNVIYAESEDTYEDTYLDDNTSTYTSAPIQVLPDLGVDTRLLTSGEITSGSQVQYEITVKNIGGLYTWGGSDPTGLYFVLPAGATLVSVTDNDESDILGIAGCVVIFEDIASYGFPERYSGLDLQGCSLVSSNGTIPAGFSGTFTFTLTASEGFASGDSAIALAFSGIDPDSVLFQMALGAGQDPFLVNVNNMTYLVYNNDELNATINRCSGVGEVVTTDDACFTVTFNKPIWASSFTIDDVVLTGGASVYSFVQNTPTQWTIRVTGLTPGQTLTVSIDPASVSDYSAIANGTQVLGANTVRYEAPGQPSANTPIDNGSAAGTGTTSVTGTLVNTGFTNLLLAIVALTLLLLGSTLVLTTKKHS